MGEFLLKYSDADGSVHERVESAGSENELRDRYADEGLLIYSIRPRRLFAEARLGRPRRKSKINIEQFLIFNQQFLTLIRAGLPILKGLELLQANIKNRRLREHMTSIHLAVKNGTPLSDAFRAEGAFPPIYVASLAAGEKSGSLAEVIDRYVQYQKITLAVRKKVLVSLIYPAVLIVLVTALVIFLVTYVVPEFAALYESMNADLPAPTVALIALGTTMNEHLGAITAAAAAIGGLLYWWLRSDSSGAVLDRLRLRFPVFGPIWVKYQVSQLCRLLSTLLRGGIPLMTALETSARSAGSGLLSRAVESARAQVKEGRSLSRGLAETGVFPTLAIEMVQVGESTGALPAMLNSVAEFFDEDVATAMTAALSLIEPAIMIFMGIFVAFVLISLYLPMFSLAEQL